MRLKKNIIIYLLIEILIKTQYLYFYVYMFDSSRYPFTINLEITNDFELKYMMK